MSRPGVAVVTGAARGIGLAIAGRLLADLTHVVLVDVDAAVEATASDLDPTGARTVPVVADLTDPAGREQVRSTVTGLGPSLQVLVNNAGITRDALLPKMGEQDFLRVLDVNLGAAWELTEHLLGTFGEGGAIVNLSSRSYLGNVGQFNYAMSKGGLVGLTRALALRLAPAVRVNAVAPGLTATEMTLAMPEQVRARLVSRVPAGRMAEPAEIAEVVAHLASPACSYVTGQTLLACGGRSL